MGESEMERFGVKHVFSKGTPTRCSKLQTKLNSDKSVLLLPLEESLKLTDISLYAHTGPHLSNKQKIYTFELRNDLTTTPVIYETVHIAQISA